MSQVTSDQLRAISSVLIKNAITPLSVQTEMEALQLTQSDPCGKVWVVGEKYYLCGPQGFIR